MNKNGLKMIPENIPDAIADFYKDKVLNIINKTQSDLTMANVN